jgi:acetylornithine deacetylase/succinyl-diaminopimelate desuccinylase-like protein
MAKHVSRWDAATLSVAMIVLGTLAAAQTPNSTDQSHAYRAAHEPQIIREFAEFLSIPNLASDGANIRKNADYIASMLKRRGVQSRLLDVRGGPPIVYGELNSPGAKHTLIFYAHYDGQPVDETQWTSPPWKPTLRDKRLEDDGKEVSLTSLPDSLPGEWRIYARSAGDDKAPIQALMSALDSLHASGEQPSVNLKFFFEGEEEAGSPHLPDAIRRYSDPLKADLWMLCDGPVHQSRRMQVFFGARGEVGVEMTIYGPTRALHDGHYGNWAPNPAALAAGLISSMRDRDGHIKIQGFYDDVHPVSESERKAIDAMPDVDSGLKTELGLAWTEGEPEKLPMRIMAPALNVRGISAGHVGDKAQNAVPTEAQVSIDFRLVPAQTPERVRQLVEDHVRKEGFYVVRQAPTAEERLTHPRIIRMDWDPGEPPSRTSMDLPASRAVVKTIEDSVGPIVKTPTLGGTVPMYLFSDTLHTPVIGVPIANHDDNQHAANENLCLQNLWDAIDMFSDLLLNVERNWK